LLPHIQSVVAGPYRPPSCPASLLLSTSFPPPPGLTPLLDVVADSGGTLPGHCSGHPPDIRWTQNPYPAKGSRVRCLPKSVPNRQLWPDSATDFPHGLPSVTSPLLQPPGR
jgi:hypothetical protein